LFIKHMHFYYIDVTGGPCAPEVLSGKRFFDGKVDAKWVE